MALAQNGSCVKSLISDEITPVVLTFNESSNIGRTLGALRWAARVVVVDSGSSDQTSEICRQFDNVVFLIHKFESHADQWNWAVADGNVTSKWVLALDADYFVSPALAEAMLKAVRQEKSAKGYSVKFLYCIFGRPLRASLYPPVTVLFQREAGHYVQDGHTQRLTLTGDIEVLAEPMLHDDRKPFLHWLQAQDRYASLEAAKLVRDSDAQFSWQQRIRRCTVIAPWAVPLYALFVRGLILDGWRGLYYAMQRGIAEAILSVKLIEHRLARAK